jgi:hypothetical protein
MQALAMERTGDIRNMAMPNLAAALKSLKQQNPADAIAIGDALKARWRHQYFDTERRGIALCYEDAQRRSFAFWRRYELINRVMDPSDPVYSIVKAAGTFSTTADHLTWKAAAAGQGRILEIICGGEATTSAVNRFGVGQVNATLASNGAITPEKFNTRSPAAAGTYGSGNTSALLAGNMLTIAINAFGGLIRWVAAPGEELYYVNGEAIGMRSLSGTSVFSTTGIFEEL